MQPTRLRTTLCIRVGQYSQNLYVIIILYCDVKYICTDERTVSRQQHAISYQEITIMKSFSFFIMILNINLLSNMTKNIISNCNSFLMAGVLVPMHFKDMHC